MSRSGRVEVPDICKVIEAYGGQAPYSLRQGWTHMKCWMHDDSRASAQVNVSTNRWQCFTCGYYEDSLDVICRMEGVGVSQGRLIAEARFGTGNSASSSKPRQRGTLFGGTGDHEGSSGDSSSRSLF